MIAVDASALLKYILHEEGWERVRKLVRERRPLYSLDHVVKEVGNAIWRHCYLRGVIRREVALELYQAFMGLVRSGVVILEPETKYLREALELALDHGITVYDSLYVAQARGQGELLTCDRGQAEVASKIGVRVLLA